MAKKAAAFRVLVATDGSSQAHAAIATVATFPWPLHTRVQAVFARQGRGTARRYRQRATRPCAAMAGCGGRCCRQGAGRWNPQRSPAISCRRHRRWLARPWGRASSADGKCLPWSGPGSQVCSPCRQRTPPACTKDRHRIRRICRGPARRDVGRQVGCAPRRARDVDQRRPVDGTVVTRTGRRWHSRDDQPARSNASTRRVPQRPESAEPCRRGTQP